MKNMWKQIGTTVAIVAITSLTGCSDGSTTFAGKPAPSETAAPPVIVSASADPSEIAPGESTTISWEVYGADKITLTASSEGLEVNETFTELTGSFEVTGIQETTEFVVTAIKTVAAAEGSEGGEEAPAALVTKQATELTTSAFITVTVAYDGVLCDATAMPMEVKAGESSIISWSVKPETAVVSISADNGEAIVPSENCATGSDEESAELSSAIEEEEQDEEEDPEELTMNSFPAEGCATVMPSAPSTTYTVTGIDAEGREGMCSVTIEIRDDEVSASINASPSTITSPGEAVTITWEASPESALVTITADPEAECDDPGLPVAAVAPRGSVTCSVSGTTTFAMIAETESGQATDQIIVTKESAAGAACLKFNRKWAFAGESVEIKAELPEGMDSSAISEVAVSGQVVELSDLLNGITVIVPEGGVLVESMSGTSEEDMCSDVVVEAITLSGPDKASDETSATRAAFSAEGEDFFGVQRNGWAGGAVRIYRSGDEVAPIDINGPLNSIAGFDPTFLQQDVATYPVNAIAVRPDNGELCIGTTGLVLCSSGGSFSKLVSYTRVSANGEDYDGSHDTCAGQTQTGRRARQANQPVGFGQVCDIIITSSGEGQRIIIATDRGVRTIRNLDNPTGQVGRPEQGESASSSGFLTYGRVTSDIELCAGRLFAATNSGIFVSDDGGEQFEAFGSLRATHALSCHEESETIFAGEVSGTVYASAASSADFSSRADVGAKILALAVDPHAPSGSETILVGTDGAGGFICRSGGASCSAIPGVAASEEAAVTVRSIAISTSPSDAQTEYHVAIAASNGRMNGSAPLSASAISGSSGPRFKGVIAAFVAFAAEDNASDE